LIDKVPIAVSFLKLLIFLKIKDKKTMFIFYFAYMLFLYILSSLMLVLLFCNKIRLQKTKLIKEYRVMKSLSFSFRDAFHACNIFAFEKKSHNDIKSRFNFNATSNVSKRFQLVEKCTLLTIHFHYQLYK